VNSKRWLVGPLALLMGLALSGCGLMDLLEPPLPPPAAPPAELTASLGELETQVRIQWAPVEGATFYEVFRAEDPEAYFAHLGTTSTTSWFDQPAEDHPLPPGVLYWYRVRACNQAGCSQLSDPVFGYAGYPPVPTEVSASDGLHADHIQVDWFPVPGASSYQVFRAAAREGDYNLVGTTTESSYLDYTALPGQRYWYRVRACNQWGCSLPSEPDRGCRAPCPP